ncbi:MAG TPA: ParA family protein [Oligoflexus sp.]|uniref:ParA family protein n=1 Tax=Oligoflexus sp. TaxID=1971216 RepID=UPI002D802904|nr:ParA family protein [Oligoflexus sp.]HET9239179.1 ParA family protein [Oligoflexus sp.]
MTKDKKIKTKIPSFREHLFTPNQLVDLTGLSRSTVWRKAMPVRQGATGAKTELSWEDLVELYKVAGRKRRESDNKILVFGNLKGGVGKSSLSSQVAMRASSLGHKTLLIDLDPQAHASMALGFSNLDEDTPTIMDCLIGKGSEKLPISDVIQEVTPFLSIIPANLSLNFLEIKLQPDHRRAERLRSLLGPIRDEWDLIIIDTNPSASTVNISAYLAADQLLIVCATDYLSVTGLRQLFEILKDLQGDFEDFAPDIKVVPNLFDVREAMAQTSLGTLRQSYGDYLSNTVVRKNVDLKEAQSLAQAVWLYNRKSPASEDIVSLTDELLADGARQ